MSRETMPLIDGSDGTQIVPPVSILSNETQDSIISNIIESACITRFTNFKFDTHRNDTNILLSHN